MHNIIHSHRVCNVVYESMMPSVKPGMIYHDVLLKRPPGRMQVQGAKMCERARMNDVSYSPSEAPEVTLSLSRAWTWSLQRLRVQARMLFTLSTLPVHHRSVNVPSYVHERVSGYVHESQSIVV